MSMLKPFHLSLPCTDIQETRRFYHETLGFGLGRANEGWMDIDIAGNQLTFMQAGKFRVPDKYYYFEGQVLPAFHFGLLLENEEWDDLLLRLRDIGLVVDEPIRFLVDEPGEHRSFFIEDPNGYVVEFKSFTKAEGQFEG